MAILYFLHLGKIFHSQPSAFDRFALDDLDVLAKGVFAENAKHKRRVISPEYFLWPLGVFGNLEETKRLKLVGREGIGLRADLTGQRGRGTEHHRNPSKPFDNMIVPRRHGGSAAQGTGLYKSKREKLREGLGSIGPP